MASSRRALAVASLLALSVPAKASAQDGKALVERYQCHRCHDGTGLEPAPQKQHCVHCHQAILNDRFEAPKASIDRWQKNIRSLLVAPSLRGIGAVFRRSWIEAFLLSPTDVRPHLLASMPRLAIGPAEAKALAVYLVPGPSPASGPDPSGVSSGRALYRRFRCADCHEFSGSGLRSNPESPYRRPGQLSILSSLAPDLAHARERLQPSAVAAWIQNPASLRADTMMPNLGVSPKQAEQLAAFVLFTPLSVPGKRPPAKRLPILERRVGYEEVEKRIFKKVCWHCHSSPDYARGDGGPGNTGGFGFAPRRLDLSSYQSISAGILDRAGERVSVFSKLADGTPLLLAAVLARHIEERGGSVEGVRGMPLGFPALPPEDIQLLESWIAQGRPR